MQIRYNNAMHNGVIYMEIETCGFTCQEQKALDYIGEPKVFFKKEYGLDEIEINGRRLRSGFKLRFRFNGGGDPIQAAKNANLFYEDIRMELGTVLDALMDKYNELLSEVGINDGYGFEIGRGTDSNIFPK